MVKRIKITNATALTSNCPGKIREVMLDFCLTSEEDAGVHKYLNWPLNAYHFQEGGGKDREEVIIESKAYGKEGSKGLRYN